MATSAREFARIFAAAADGAARSFRGHGATGGGAGGYARFVGLGGGGGGGGGTGGMAFSAESYERAKMMSGIFSAIADVYRGIADAEDAAQAGVTLGEDPKGLREERSDE